MTRKGAETAGPQTLGSALHDPANRLYDESCSLVAAAEALREATKHPDSAPALVATLGCVEASLDALVVAVSQMHGWALARHDARDQEVARRREEAAEISSSFAGLRRELAASRAGCAAARDVTGRFLAER